MENIISGILILITIGCSVFTIGLMINTHNKIKDTRFRGRPEMMTTLYGYGFFGLLLLIFGLYQLFS